MEELSRELAQLRFDHSVIGAAAPSNPSSLLRVPSGNEQHTDHGWFGSDRLLELQLAIFEHCEWTWLPKLAATCRVFRELVYGGGPLTRHLWQGKHLEHFRWASARLGAAGRDRGAPASFAALHSVQRASLAGDRLDFRGKWTKDERDGKFVYHLRLTLLRGAAGNALWRGDPEQDGPFWRGLYERYTENTSKDGGDRMCRMGPYCFDDYQLSRSQRAQILTAISERGCYDSGNNPGPTTHELDEPQMVGGHIQWFLSNETDAEELQQYTATFAPIIGTEKLTGRRALEYVVGVHFPREHRVIMVGTHFNDAGRGVIGLDVYDLTVSPTDGLTLSGITKGNDSSWRNKIEAVASVLPEEEKPEDGVCFFSVSGADELPV